jgi:hypothetical protein
LAHISIVYTATDPATIPLADRITVRVRDVPTDPAIAAWFFETMSEAPPVPRRTRERLAQVLLAG